ncbi:MAG: leucyl/phenylalanyl-tRNA--protein transferase [Loktanella sp.]|nr:leucyl/phenylalanyl-tRNA--protein transferase [Loktanella sp.]
MRDEGPKISPELLLAAYRAGVFPMSEGRDDPEVFWVDPRQRGILPLDAFRMSRSLRKTIRRGHLHATTDLAFDRVVEGCAAREETWINATIFDLYAQLHAQGHAHSVEIWQDEALVGGVYGVVIGGAFFGESMFSTVTDASKMALAYLVDRLRTQGFTLFDTQFVTDHLLSLGAVEIPRSAYHAALADAVLRRVDYGPAGMMAPVQDVIQRSTQTS